tara:strand:+ start:1685 stop:1936 length:252 start_codon:yes stop_codon:yes gene_type:complete
MSRLKDLVVNVESHLGFLLNDEGLTNDQALTVIEQEEFVVGGQSFKGTFIRQCAEQIINEWTVDDLYYQPFLKLIGGNKNADK